MTSGRPAGEPGEGSGRRARLIRFAAVATTLALLGFGLVEGLFVFWVAAGHSGTIGLDFTVYQDRTHDWLSGAGFYLPRQLTGEPYVVTAGDALYPPVVLLLLVPFSILPGWLWWAIPLAIMAAALRQLRPPMPTLPLLAAILVYPRTWEIVLYGNPSLWVFAALAAGLAWRWPAVFVVLKLTLAPFAIIGIRRRGWWLAAGVLVLAGLPFGALWLDWLTATINGRLGPGFGLDYVLGEWPIAIMLLIAGLARWRRESLIRPSGAG